MRRQAETAQEYYTRCGTSLLFTVMQAIRTSLTDGVLPMFADIPDEADLFVHVLGHRPSYEVSKGKKRAPSSLKPAWWPDDIEYVAYYEMNSKWRIKMNTIVFSVWQVAQKCGVGWLVTGMLIFSF